MKKIGILVLCAAMVMAFAVLAVFAEGEPTVQGFVYAEDKTVFRYVNADASAVSVKLYAGMEDAEALGAYPMTLGENGVWSATVEGDQQQRYYTFVYTVGEESVEIPDPTNSSEGQTRSYIPALVKYDLWIAGVQVSNFNAADILGEADEGVFVKYDAASNTLTLAAGTNIVTEDVGISYKGTQPLTVKLEGDTTVTAALGALRSDASVTFTAENTAMFYAVTTGEGVGIHIGENGVLALEGKALVNAKSQKYAGLYLSRGANIQIGQNNILIILSGGQANDLQAEDENFTVPMQWITQGRLVPNSGRPGVKVTIGDDPQPYTYVGCPGDRYGIGFDTTTADHSFWLTQTTWETGFGYVAFTRSEETRRLVLYNAKIHNADGPAIRLTEQTEIILQGKNVLTGSTAGLEVTNATVSGYHGMLVADGIKIAESLVIREGALELESDKPLFGEILPDLSQYAGEYTLIAESEKAPAVPVEPENPEGGEPADPQIDLLTGQPAPEEEKKPYLIYKLTPQRNHTMDAWVAGSKPDCTNEGVAGHQLCTVCRLYLDADGNEIPAPYLPVAYDSHDFTYTPLEEKDVHLATCARNPAHVYTLPCFGGAEICLERPVCEGCGEKHGDRLFHIFGTEFTENSEVGHWSLCQRPGCGQADEPKAHSGGFVSCDKPYVCEICGHEYGGVAGHSYTDKASDQLESAATCTHADKYFAQCDHCDAVSEDVTVSVGQALAHTYSDVWATNNAGHWHVCTVCRGISLPERHVEIVRDQRQATEEAPGYTGDVYCQVCDALVFRGTEIPQLEKSTKMDPMVFVAVGALAVSALGFGGVIVFDTVKKKKAVK